MENKYILSVGTLSHGGLIVVKVFESLGQKVHFFDSFVSAKLIKFVLRKKSMGIITLRSYPMLLFFKETIYFQNMNVLYGNDYKSIIHRLLTRIFRFNKLHVCQSKEVEKKLKEKFPFLRTETENFIPQYINFLQKNIKISLEVKLYDCCAITSDVVHRRNELINEVLKRKRLPKFLQIGGKKIITSYSDVVFFNKLSHQETIKELSKAKSLLITSEFETVFLPLIEAIFLKIKIIFLGQDFVRKILNELEYSDYEIINLK